MRILPLPLARIAAARDAEQTRDVLVAVQSVRDKKRHGNHLPARRDRAPVLDLRRRFHKRPVHLGKNTTRPDGLHLRLDRFRTPRIERRAVAEHEHSRLCIIDPGRHLPCAMEQHFGHAWMPPDGQTQPQNLSLVIFGHRTRQSEFFRNDIAHEITLHRKIRHDENFRLGQMFQSFPQPRLLLPKPARHLTEQPRVPQPPGQFPGRKARRRIDTRPVRQDQKRGIKLRSKRSLHPHICSAS